MRYDINKQPNGIEALFFPNVVQRQRQWRRGDLPGSQRSKELWRTADVDQFVISRVFQSFGPQYAPEGKGRSRGQTVGSEGGPTQIFVGLIVLAAHDGLAKTVDDAADNHH